MSQKKHSKFSIPFHYPRTSSIDSSRIARESIQESIYRFYNKPLRLQYRNHHQDRHLREHPSLKGLEHLIDLHVKHASDSARDNLQLLHSLVIKLIDEKPVYRCDGCGYSGKTLFWQCPSCKEWGTIKPILGIEGE